MLCVETGSQIFEAPSSCSEQITGSYKRSQSSYENDEVLPVLTKQLYRSGLTQG